MMRARIDADGELGVGEVAAVVALARRAEEGGGAQFRRDEGAEHGPPRQLAAADG